MNKKEQIKKIGRPQSGKKASKPNITIVNSLQEEAKNEAARKGIGYSEYVAMALNRQIAIDENKRVGLSSVEPNESPERHQIAN